MVTPERITIEMKTNLIHLVDVNTYNSLIEFRKLDSDGFIDNEWVKLYIEDIEACAKDTIDSFLKKYPPLKQYEFKATNFKYLCPEDFRFDRERCIFDFSFNSSLLKEMIQVAKTDKEFVAYCQDYGSRSGFISNYPVEMTEFISSLDTDKLDSATTPLAVAMYINYVIDNDENLSHDRDNFVCQYDFEEKMYDSDSYAESDDFKNDYGILDEEDVADEQENNDYDEHDEDDNLGLDKLDINKTKFSAIDIKQGGKTTSDREVKKNQYTGERVGKTK